MEVQPALPPIEALNEIEDGDAFGRPLALFFETRGPFAKRLAAGRPYASYAALLDHAEALAWSLPEAEQVELVNGHPRLGARAEVVARGSALSLREQAYDQALDGEAPAEAERVDAELGALNRTYEQRFGFRCVIFVNRRPRAALIPLIRERLERPRAEELQTALGEVFAIARDRLRTLGGT